MDFSNDFSENCLNKSHKHFKIQEQMVTECTVVYTAVAPGPQCRSIVALE